MCMVEDILKRLENGESADDIAKEFTTALNTAHTQHKEVLKSKEKEKQIEQEKCNCMRDILNDVEDFVLAYYTDNEEEKAEVRSYFEVLTPKAVIDFIDSISIELVELEKNFDKIEKLFDFNKTNSKNIDDFFKNFITKMGL